METLPHISSGTAHITITNNDNSIVVVQGSNKMISSKIIDKNEALIKKANYVLIQNEIPVETTHYIIEFCYRNDIKVIYNPAPFLRIDESYLKKRTYVTPNEIECSGLLVGEVEDALEKYPQKLIVTCGEKGVLYQNGEKIINVPAFKSKAVDTTGAGDTFNGVLAAFLNGRLNLEDAIKAASISIRKFGAQTGMPTKNE